MYNARLLAIMLVSGVVLTACSGSRNDPLGPGDSEPVPGRLSKGANGPNRVVTLANSDSVFQELNEELFTAYLKGLSTLSAHPELDETIRVNGWHSGYAEVDGSLAPSDTAIAFEFGLTFYDYSDSASIFIGGNMQFHGRASLVNQELRPRSLFAEGEFQFAGLYNGSVEYHFFLIITEENSGTLMSIFTPDSILSYYHNQGYLTFESGGSSFFLQPYPELD